MSRHTFPKILLALLLVLGLATGLMRYTAPGRPALSRVEVLVRDTLAPLQGGVTLITRRASGLIDSWASYQSMQQELEAKRLQVDELIAENSRLQEYRLENARLKKLLRFVERSEGMSTLLPAQVIGRDPDNWYHTLIINVGKAEGITPDMAVITHQGLVGRVVAVTTHTSEVLTIMDQDGAVGALVQDSRFPGVVEGLPGGNGLQMIHLPHDAPVQKNQVIITSGLGGLFPKGLRIGYVTDVLLDPSALIKKAMVKPFVDFDRLEEVLVILDKGEEE
ncbi:hypothetical protein SY88_21485 [Clostridiales bacterium PH28_bin88]|nr:hypothetical protein SY88_21485 [Clostridiales bacterium PH28_bin88]